MSIKSNGYVYVKAYAKLKPDAAMKMKLITAIDSVVPLFYPVMIVMTDFNSVLRVQQACAHLFLAISIGALGQALLA